MSTRVGSGVFIFTVRSIRARRCATPVEPAVTLLFSVFLRAFVAPCDPVAFVISCTLKLRTRDRTDRRIRNVFGSSNEIIEDFGGAAFAQRRAC